MLREEGAANLMDLHQEYWQTNANPARTSQEIDLYRYYGALPDKLLRAFADWFKADCEVFAYDCERTLCEIFDWKTRVSN